MKDKNKYPKIMEVSFDHNMWYKRCVLAHNEHGHIVAYSVSKGFVNLKEIDADTKLTIYKYAREIYPFREFKEAVREDNKYQ